MDQSLPDSPQILYVGENGGEELGSETKPFVSLSSTLAINRHKFVKVVLLPGDHKLESIDKSKYIEAYDHEENEPLIPSIFRIQELTISS